MRRSAVTWKLAGHGMLLALGLTACDAGHAAPVDRPELGIDATDGSDIQAMCAPFPVLAGGEFSRDAELRPGFTVHVVTTPQEASVTLKGLAEPTPDPVVVSAAELTQGYDTTLAVHLQAGAPLTVHLFSPCDMLPSAE